MLKQNSIIASSIIDGSPLAIVVFSTDEHVLVWNKAAERLFGWTADEIIGQGYPLVPTGKEQEFEQLKQLMLRGEAIVNFETQRQTKDGRLLDIHMSYAPLHDEQGNIEAYMLILDDITMRKRLVQNLIQSEERFRILFNNVNDAIVLVRLDEEGGPAEFLEVNDCLCCALGYTRQELLNMRPCELLMPETLKVVYQSKAEFLLQGRVTFEAEALTKVGDILTFEVSSHTFSLENEQVVLAVARDITERKRAQALLESTNERLNAIIDCAPLGVYVLDKERRVCSWNRAAEQIYGWTEAEVLGKFLPIVPKHRKQKFLESTERVLNGEALTGLEVIDQHCDGSQVEVRLFSSPLYDGDGQITSMQVLVENITELKRVANLVEQERERARTAMRMASLGAMAAGIAHELSQPLNSMRVITDGLLYSHDQGQQLEYVRIIKSLRKLSAQLERVSDIINRIRSLVHRGPQAELSPCNVNTSINNVLDIYDEQIARYGIKIVKQLDKELPPILARQNGLDEILGNLLENAIHAVREAALGAKEIRLKTWAGDKVYVTILDNGFGISDKIQANLFEPFITTKAQGMGLGLFVVQSLVISYNGRISCANNELGGATFNLEFPPV